MNTQGVMELLMVEDSPDDAFIYQEMLKDGANQTYHITHVDKINDALKMVQKQRFSAVLLDLNLPDVSGIDNIRILKSESPEIPIIVLTGMASDHVAFEALNVGAQDYLVKGQEDAYSLRRCIRHSIERQKAEASLLRRANYDQLTGLVSRSLFLDRLERRIIRARRNPEPFAVMYVDLDGFKQVNDSFGHAKGDALLYRVASRLKQQCWRESDTVARLGGDEFAVLLDRLAEPAEEGCTIVAKRIIHAIKEQPFHVDEHLIPISASVGAAIFPEGGEDVETLLDNADKAMYRAKQECRTSRLMDGGAANADNLGFHIEHSTVDAA